MNPIKIKYNAWILILGCILFVPFLGGVHLFDWDEINFAECAREMIVSGNYSTVTINFLPFWEKPPLFIWMQVASMKLFGINEFAARLPDAVCGICTLLFIFNVGKKIWDEKFALLWTAFYACSFLPHLYFRSGIIDPWFNLFIFSSVFYLFLFHQKRKWTHLILSAFLIGLAALTKGPVALLILGACFLIVSLLKKFKDTLSFKEVILFACIAAITGSAWFFLLIAQNKAGLISEFFNYQVRLLVTEDSGHGGPFYYHVAVLLTGCFPASVFALGTFSRSPVSSGMTQRLAVWMKVLFWLVLILFSIVKTKIIHYSSLCYFPITFFAADYAYKMIHFGALWKKYQTFFFQLISLCIGIALILAGYLEKMKTYITESGIVKDNFALANLQAEVPSKSPEYMLGIIFILFINISMILLLNKKIIMGIVLLFISCLITIPFAIYIFVPKVEGYSQRAAIEFYKAKSEEDCYVETLGFKSYAHLFYLNKKQPENLQSLDKEWLLNNEAGKPVYFVCKITRAEEYKKQYPFLEELYSKNGFVFFIKK